MSVRTRTAVSAVALAALFTTACMDDPARPDTSSFRPAFSLDASELEFVPIADPSGGLQLFLTAVNQQLAAAGAPYVVREASIVFAAEAFDENRASIIIANDRTHRLGYRFVKNDPRRATVGAVIRQASFLSFTAASTGPGTFVDAKPSIDASFDTWSARECANLPIENNFLPAGIFPSAILGLGGFISDPLLSDINTPGFLPGFIFDLVLGPGASQAVLGVTFPFVWTSGGQPTDIDGDGNDDAAFAEIWYNNAFRWNTNGTGPGVDIETVTLHENGHALGLGHFGKVQVNTSSGKLNASPRAAMNAVILGTLRNPLGTDEASFCGNWGNWD